MANLDDQVKAAAGAPVPAGSQLNVDGPALADTPLQAAASESPAALSFSEQLGAQQTTTSFDTTGMTGDELKREFDVFRDVLNNVNNTLRFQIQLGVPLMAACVTVLNIVPPQEHQQLLNDFDRWVFVPAVISMAVGYHGLEHHWYSNKRHARLDSDIRELYKLVRYKYKMVRICLILQALGLLLMMAFVLLEYK